MSFTYLSGFSKWEGFDVRPYFVFSLRVCWANFQEKLFLWGQKFSCPL